MIFRVSAGGQNWEGDKSFFEQFVSAEDREMIAREGVFLLPDGEPMDAVAQRHMRSHFLREDSLAGVSDAYMDSLEWAGDEAPRFVIPGAWRWGTAPMLTGPYKAGKSTLAVDLAAALAIPGRRFLDHFDPSELPMDAHIWYINAENPVADFMSALFDTGAYDGEWEVERRPLHVEHLEAMGGASLFDLTDPVKFDTWARHLSECLNCDETGDFRVPTVLIVDGLTAILGGATERYGQWYAKFRELLRYVDIPNALVIGHSTMKGDHPMGGTEGGAGPDGLWLYTANEGRNRWMFSTMPRLGSPRVDPLRIEMGADSRLRAVSNSAAKTSASSTVTASLPAGDSGASVDQRILAFIRAENAATRRPRINDIRRAIGGDSKKADVGVSELLASGALTVDEVKGLGGTAKLYRIGQDPDALAEGGKDSK